MLLCACGKSDDGKVASCHIESQQNCREYRGANLAIGNESLAKLCTTLVSTAKFAETPCPTAKLIGKCSKPEGTDFYYEGYSETARELEAACKQGAGTFVTN